MKFVETILVLREEEYELAQRLLARENRERAQPLDLNSYLCGVASSALATRLDELAAVLSAAD